MKIRASWIVLVIILAVLVVSGLNISPLGQAAMPETYRDKIVVTASGAAGAAEGSAVSADWHRGYLRAIYLDYSAGISTTTDLTVRTTSPAATIVTLTDTYTDGWLYPGVEYTGATGSGLSAFKPFPVDDHLTIAAAQTTSGTVVTVYTFYGD